jgi:curved DNA-binding protein CbpA
MVKDYYSILGIAPAASVIEIKKAYRSLAKRFHPDIIGNDPSGLLWFAEIKSAYEVLMHPTARYRYHEELWLLRSQGKNAAKPSITDAVSILKEIIQLEKSGFYAGGIYAHPDFWAYKISELLQPGNIAILNTQPDTGVNTTIVHYLIKKIPVLPVSYLGIFREKINSITFSGKSSRMGQLEKLIRERKRSVWLEKYSWIAVVLLTVFLLVAIKWMIL